MRKITLILFCVISLCVNLIAQSLDFTKDGRHYYIASPNGRYFTGRVDEGSGCFFDVATGNHYTTEEDSVLIFAVNNDGIACGALVGKPGVWVRGQEWKMLTALATIGGKPITGGEIIGMSADATKFITLMFYDGKSIPVYFELDDFNNWDDDNAWTFRTLPTPDKGDLLYNMDPAYVQVCGMNYDGTRILGRYVLADGKRQVPFIWQKGTDGEWSINFVAERCLFVEDVVNGNIILPEREGLTGNDIIDYDVFRESVEKGIIFDLSPFMVVAWTGSGRYIPVCANVLDKDGFESNYAAVIDVDKDTLIVFTAINNAGTVSVNDKGEVMIYTPYMSTVRDSYVATIDNPTEAVSLLEYTRQRTNGAIDLAEYMTYQRGEDFDGNPVYSTLTGSAVWANEGNAFVTYNYDEWNETLVPQCFFVNFEDVEDDEDGENDEEKPNIPEVLGDTLKFGDVDYCIGAIFNKVSNNGKYVAGYASDNYGGMNVGFVYLVEEDTLICLNPEWEDNVEQSHFVKATAMDVSDAGIVVGQYAFDDMQVRPAFYNITTGAWTELERPANVVGKIKEPGSLYGEATSISADGKYIGGYVVAQMDNSTRLKQIRRNVACVWVRTNDDELNPIYELQKPIDEVHTKIMTHGDWAWHMSDDAKWLGGNSSANSGCFNMAIWENNYIDTLKRNVLIGKSDWDRSEDKNEDGIIDEGDGADAGQYFWYGIVTCVSPSGEWIVGYHTFNGTGYSDVEISTPVGFCYNTKTEVLEDTLFAGCPTVVFDNGEMIFDQEILSSSVDKKVQCGTYVINIDGLGQRNVPLLIIDREKDNTEDDDGDEDITEGEVYGLYVASENPEMGGVKIILVAEAIEGFEFVEWSDGNTSNPRIIELTEDTELYARFKMVGDITNVETSKISVAEVYSRDGVLYVEGVESDYHVLDMAGRLIYSGRESALNLPRGVYLVTIAGEVEKVVI